jgi:hypothetical protein
MFACRVTARKQVCIHGPSPTGGSGTLSVYMWNQAEIYRRRRRAFVAGLGLVLLLIIIIVAISGGGPVKHVATNTTLPRSPAPLTYTATAGLTEPVRAASAAPIPGENAFTLFGGLDADLTATATVATVSPTVAKPVGFLIVSLYGTAAVTIKNTEYIFGGITGSLRSNGTTSGTVEFGILSYSPTATASAVTEIAHLPSPNYGLSAAVIGTTAYIVGGFDGTNTLDTIDSWSPGQAKAKVLKTHLPLGLRYTAVAAVGDKLVIAGGLEASGAASRQIFIFDATTAKLRKLRAKLPSGIFAASAATLGKLAYVIGGAIPGAAGAPTASAQIYSVDPATGKLALAGALPIARDEAAATVVDGNTIYLAGGLSGGGANATTIADVGMLTATTSAATTKP